MHQNDNGNDFFPLFHIVIHFLSGYVQNTQERKTSENIRNILGSDKKNYDDAVVFGCFLSYLPTLLFPSDLLFETIPLAASLD